jgi:hypothetical protein
MRLDPRASQAHPRARRRARRDRGTVLVFLAVAMVTILVGAGLAIDLGRGYVLKAQVSRAVDAAALAAARSLRSGEDIAVERGTAIAAANGLQGGFGQATLDFVFGTTEDGELTVTAEGAMRIPTLLMKLIGQDVVGARSRAVTVVPPIDLVLVLDQSGSLSEAGAWDDLQDAAQAFVANFDDDIDQMGMVSFQLRAIDRFQIQQPFVGLAVSTIEAMPSLGFTNTGEGLRLAYEQLDGPNVRDAAAKVVVFFTDGRPTAFRANAGNSDRVLAAYTGAGVFGFWNNPNALPMDVRPPPNGCQGVGNCFGYTKQGVFDKARDNGAFWASEIRSSGALLYTIGLGDTSQPLGSILQPDPDFLRLLANEDGIADPSQPRGRMYFAPSSAELAAIFQLVAQDLLVRLAQ